MTPMMANTTNDGRNMLGQRSSIFSRPRTRGPNITRYAIREWRLSITSHSFTVASRASTLRFEQDDVCLAHDTSLPECPCRSTGPVLHPDGSESGGALHQI